VETAKLGSDYGRRGNAKRARAGERRDGSRLYTCSCGFSKDVVSGGGISVRQSSRQGRNIFGRCEGCSGDREKEMEKRWKKNWGRGAETRERREGKSNSCCLRALVIRELVLRNKGVLWGELKLWEKGRPGRERQREDGSHFNEGGVRGAPDGSKGGSCGRAVRGKVKKLIRGGPSPLPFIKFRRRFCEGIDF